MADVNMINYSTDSNGAPLSPPPWQVSNDATTNLLFPSEPPANTTVTLPANEYTLWIEGTGSITSTYGTATEASPLTFTGNATAELFTVVGSVDIAQIALGNSKGAYARSTTAAASIPATPYAFPAANIDPSSAHIAMTFDAGLVDKTLIDIGGVALLSYGDVGDGTELVVNGGFDTDSGWAKGSEWDISGGTANCNSTNSATSISQSGGVIGEEYVLTFDLVEITSGRVQAFIGGAFTENISTVGTHRLTNKGVSTTLVNFRESNTFVGSIDNVSVQKATKGLILSDGTNFSAVPLSAGTHKLEIILVDDTMQLILDSVPGPVVPYIPIPAGVITNTTPKFYGFYAKPMPPVPVTYAGVQVTHNANSVTY